MSECIGCQRLNDELVNLIQLSTGRRVCSYCPEWMIETEAKELLSLPLKQRQRLLLIKEAARGPESIKILKARIKLIFDQRKLQKSNKSQ